MGKILAIDYGLKRTGIAYSDEIIPIAHPLKTVQTHLLWDFLNKYFLENNVQTIVLGMPKKLDGSSTNSTPYVKGFKKKLCKEFPQKNIIMIDERFTSKIAKKSILACGVKKKRRQDKSLIDKVSATIILQNYLDYKN